MKKYFLSAEQRKVLVEALLSKAENIKTDCSKRGIGGAAMPESSQATVQENEHLAQLFKSEDHEL